MQVFGTHLKLLLEGVRTGCSLILVRKLPYSQVPRPQGVALRGNLSTSGCFPVRGTCKGPVDTSCKAIFFCTSKSVRRHAAAGASVFECYGALVGVVSQAVSTCLTAAVQ